MIRKLTVILVLLTALAMPPAAEAQMKAGQVDIFMGLDFNYRDQFYNGRVMDVNLAFTPGVKWNMGHRWEIAAQVLVPFINQLDPSYGKVKLNVATISKQFAAGKRWRFEVSGGQFSYNRYGVDFKTMFIVNKWLALSGEAGYTGFCFFAFSDVWQASYPDRVSFLVGPEFWLDRWTTQFVLRGGRYTYGDYGVEAQAWRHFKRVSVGLFASYSDLVKENAGFRVTVMLPPYKTKRRKVNFRPASNFKLQYRNKSNAYATREYATDPEENIRQGWFDRDMNPWGPNTMKPVFVYTNDEPSDMKEASDRKEEDEQRREVER